jgi:hypothetical protein
MDPRNFIRNVSAGYIRASGHQTVPWELQYLIRALAETVAPMMLAAPPPAEASGPADGERIVACWQCHEDYSPTTTTVVACPACGACAGSGLALMVPPAVPPPAGPEPSRYGYVDPPFGPEEFARAGQPSPDNSFERVGERYSMGKGPACAHCGHDEDRHDSRLDGHGRHCFAYCSCADYSVSPPARPADGPVDGPSCTTCDGIGRVGVEQYRCPDCNEVPPAVPPPAGPELDLCSPSCGPTCPMCGGKYLELRDQPPAGPGEVDVFADIRAERARQDAKWGGPEHDDGHALVEWAHFIREHLDKALRGPFAKTRRRMVEVAALAVAAIEAWDRQEIAAGRQPPAVPAAGPELDLCSPSCGPTCPMCGGKYLELRDPPPAGPGEAASQAAPLPPHTLHLCRFCGSLWRCWASDGSWSLVTKIQPCPPCCDNVAMTADNMDPPPPAAPSPGEGEVERLAARAYNEYCRIVDDPAGDDPSISWGLLAPTTQKAWAAAVRAILSAAAGRR